MKAQFLLIFKQPYGRNSKSRLFETWKKSHKTKTEKVVTGVRAVERSLVFQVKKSA